MHTKDIIIRGARKIFRLCSGKIFLPPQCDCDRQSSNDKIFNQLSTGKPTMIARFGTTELNCINNYLCVKSRESITRKCINYITDNTHTPWWNESHWEMMSLLSGIFPVCQKTAEKFSELYLNDAEEIDMLACHQYYEKFLPLKPNIERIQLEMLYPFFVERPWTRVLKGKRVLVVHPFENTIKAQYIQRHRLFNNVDILPDFDLITLKAVQTIAGNKSNFENWFDALNFMKDKVSQIDFDVCIIGCGAYGLPIAAHVKRMGKQAIHMGGGTQLLFGILGKRWTEQYPKIGIWHYRPGLDINIDYTPLFNKSWIFPLDSDTPKEHQKVEGGCYWK